MIYFFMLAVLVGLIGIGVLVLYLMDRVHKIENKSVGGGGTGEAFGTSDPHFEGLGGQRLWAVLTASEGAVANSAIVRRFYSGTSRNCLRRGGWMVGRA